MIETPKKMPFITRNSFNSVQCFPSVHHSLDAKMIKVDNSEGEIPLHDHGEEIHEDQARQRIQNHLGKAEMGQNLSETAGRKQRLIQLGSVGTIDSNRG